MFWLCQFLSFYYGIWFVACHFKAIVNWFSLFKLAKKLWSVKYYWPNRALESPRRRILSVFGIAQSIKLSSVVGTAYFFWASVHSWGKSDNQDSISIVDEGNFSVTVVSLTDQEYYQITCWEVNKERQNANQEALSQHDQDQLRDDLQASLIYGPA